MLNLTFLCMSVEEEELSYANVLYNIVVLLYLTIIHRRGGEKWWLFPEKCWEVNSKCYPEFE